MDNRKYGDWELSGWEQGSWRRGGGAGGVARGSRFNPLWNTFVVGGVEDGQS